MKLIVGLGNPGKEYTNTRHNVGFNFLDYCVESFKITDSWTKKFDGVYLQTTIGKEKVIFFKPHTFMNLSGIAVHKIMDYFKIDISDLLIVSDDMDLLIGNYKLKLKGSSGGHNGLKNIEEQLGTSNYKRLKIGISKNSDGSSKDYVLGNFSSSERDILTHLFQDLEVVLKDYLVLPFEDLMSKYNRKNR